MNPTRGQAVLTSAEAIARYFLLLAAQTEESSPITQMQLHKLLYYAQGWSLATRHKPLFRAAFQAWVHGPVETSVYPKFADYEGRPIALHEASDDGSLSADDRALVESTWMNYGRYSAWRLREMSHAEPPWRDARGLAPEDAASRAPITDEAMASHFSAVYAANCRRVGLDAETLSRSVASARAGLTIPFEQLKAEHNAAGDRTGTR